MNLNNRSEIIWNKRSVFLQVCGLGKQTVHRELSLEKAGGNSELSSTGPVSFQLHVGVFLNFKNFRILDETSLQVFPMTFPPCVRVFRILEIFEL